ncbi:MAG: aminoacyl-tRNA hydrolase [Patescibacteria group bacterium]|nr:aminoacyl-tRNA hydrolase [Patescibacteria group bacterium]
MKTKPNAKLIIGLGNPGKEYEKTYHNAGFLFIDFLISNNRLTADFFSKYKNFEYLKTKNFILIRPTLFMNESGKAVLEILKYFSARPEDIIIVHDDSDIELGKYKISAGRGSAGHRGVESIIKSLGNKNFQRLRIGTANKKHFKQKAGDFALKKIGKSEIKAIQTTFKDAITSGLI